MVDIGVCRGGSGQERTSKGRKKADGRMVVIYLAYKAVNALSSGLRGTQARPSLRQELMLLVLRADADIHSGGKYVLPASVCLYQAHAQWGVGMSIIFCLLSALHLHCSEAQSYHTMTSCLPTRPNGPCRRAANLFLKGPSLEIVAAFGSVKEIRLKGCSLERGTHEGLGLQAKGTPLGGRDGLLTSLPLQGHEASPCLMSVLTFQSPLYGSEEALGGGQGQG